VDAPSFSNTVHRILVVDDEEIVLVALSETLRRERYQVVTVNHPVAALEILRKETFSVVIIDHEMPVLTGLELLALAKEIQPDTPRILITAVLSLDTVIGAINKGEVFRFIVKPWLREELLVTVKNAVQRYELIRKNAELQISTQAMNEQLVQLNRALEQQVALVAEQNLKLTEMHRASEQNLQRAMELCLHALQAFSPVLGSHARKTSRLCRAIAEAALLRAEDRRVLEISSSLYDLGLLGLPRQLIARWQEKAATLTDAERAQIEHHPPQGQDLAGYAGFGTAAGDAIRAHHERYDGQGYPDRLAGEQIPWLGRLLAVAVFAAARNEPIQSLVEAVNAGSGTMFDPKAVAVFLKALPLAEVGRQAREVSLAELRPGMILARGIYTSGGLLLIPEGLELNSATIETLVYHNRVHPITESLAVYC
jgi:response regulator RpfG family c-di-GMP phosphodiesterase